MKRLFSLAVLLAFCTPALWGQELREGTESGRGSAKSFERNSGGTGQRRPAGHSEFGAVRRRTAFFDQGRLHFRGPLR